MPPISFNPNIFGTKAMGGEISPLMLQFLKQKALGNVAKMGVSELPQETVIKDPIPPPIPQLGGFDRQEAQSTILADPIPQEMPKLGGFTPSPPMPTVQADPIPEQMPTVEKSEPTEGGKVFTEGDILKLEKGQRGVAQVVKVDGNKVTVMWAGDKFPYILNEEGLKQARLATVEDFGTIRPGGGEKSLQLRRWKDMASRQFALSPAEGGKVEFQARVTAAQDLADTAKEQKYHIPINGDGSITIYHGTSAENAQKINTDGKIESQSFFSPNEKGAEFYGKIKNKSGEILPIKVDARDIEYSSGTGEIYAPNGLVKDTDGIWKSPDRISKLSPAEGGKVGDINSAKQSALKKLQGE